MKQLVATLAILSASCGRADGIPPGRLTSEVDSLLAHVPADARFLFGVEMQRFHRTAVFQRLASRFVRPVPELAQLEQLCDVDTDLATAVDRILVSVGGDLGQDDDLNVILQLRTATKDTIAACISRASAAGLAVADQGGMTIYSAGDRKMYTYWAKPDTVVLSYAGADGIRKAIAGGARQNAQLMSFVKRVDTAAGLWLAGPAPASLSRRIAGPRSPPIGYFGTVDGLGEGVAVSFGMRLESEAAAERLAGFDRRKLKQQLTDPTLVALVDKLSIRHGGSDVVFRLQLGPAEIETLLSSIGLGQADTP